MGWKRAFSCALGLVAMGCQEPVQHPMLNPVTGAGIADQYVCAPTSEPGTNLFFADDYLYATFNDRLYELHLSKGKWGPDPNPAKRIDTVINPYNGGGTLTPGYRGLFAYSSIGEDEQITGLLKTCKARLADCWFGRDDSFVQFSQDGNTWVVSSYERISTRSTEGRQSEDHQFGNEYESATYLVPGASGRLAYVHRMENSPGRPEFWFDPLENRVYPSSTLPTDFGKRRFWVDQGHVLSESEGKIQDHGVIPGFKPVKASENAVALSPWSVTRSEDQKTLVVRSIYRGGPTWTIKPLQDAIIDFATYGKHALYVDGEFYDLRTGKWAARLEMDDDQDYVITTEKYITGTTKALVLRDIALPVDREKVLEVLKDLLDLGDSEE